MLRPPPACFPAPPAPAQAAPRPAPAAPRPARSSFGPAPRPIRRRSARWRATAPARIPRERPSPPRQTRSAGR
ncbi:MAG: hypothetical protein CSA74_10095 [Rhodobacterales bacterium]|nr:MAG: hypothetical protein CSA74_10095 [Rhodobacterales bacterium]